MSSSANTARSRSPRFPGYPLKEAIGYAERIYAGVHRSPIDAETAFRLMGFAGKSGASATALGSVRQFGLIEGVGDNTRITDLALKILEPASQAERREAVAEAARKPEVFRSILERFNGRIPTADEPVRAHLIRELGFSKRGVEECLTSLRLTLELIGDVYQSETERADAAERSLEASAPATSEARTSSSDASSSIRIPLTRDCTAELRFTGPISERALTNLIRHIELTKEVWAED